MSVRVEQLLQEAQKLSAEEFRLLCRALLLKVAVPLQDPEGVYDDWNDSGVDAAYSKAW